MSPDQQEATILALHDAVVEIRATLNDGLKAMVIEHKSELKSINIAVQEIRGQVSSHISKEDVLFAIFQRAMNTGVAVTGALLFVLLGIIGWLLTHPNTWINPG